MYDKHDETMFNFAEKFNNSPVCGHIEMRPNQVETFDNDGIFIDINTNNSIGYDWEYRDRYFAYCELSFDSLGQYERKLRKPSIQLALQCDSTETGIAVGWHEDWLQEEKERRRLKTDFSYKENGAIRYTTHFQIYSFDQVDSLKNMIASAMRLRIYSSKIFDMMSGTSSSFSSQKIITDSPNVKQTTAQMSNTQSVKSLKEFFESKGLKVVDKREKGGCLWVMGSEEEIGSIVKEACRTYHIGGNYGVGRSTDKKVGWFTRAKK